MGVSTDGQLNYGIDFGEEADLPWLDEKYDNDIEDWWMDVGGFTSGLESPYTEDGEYKSGFSKNDPRVDVWFEERQLWRKANPVPVEVIIHCSGDYPCYILAVKGYTHSISRGSSIEVDTKCVPAYEENEFYAFLKEYQIETEDTLKWLLTSYWG